MKKILWGVLALGVVSTAHGQLIVSITSTGSGLPRAMYYDIAGGTTTTLWNSGANNSAYGIVADDGNGKLWYTTGARIGYGTYGSAPMSTTAIAGIYFPDNTTVANAWDLARANGNLYTWTRGNGTFARGIYQAPTVPNAQNHLVLNPVWQDTSVAANQYDFQGLTYRPQDGLFYGIDTSGNRTMGLYSIDVFGGGGVNFLTALPSGHTHVDGLTFDSTGTTMYMSEHVPTDQKIYVFSLNYSTLTYGATYSLATTDATQRGTGITWSPNVFNPVPEPASLLVIGSGIVAFLRRRKRS